jgi:nucleoid-associated protein YgaU
MTRETRIGLLVGLVFIVMFGLVLTELTGTKSASDPKGARDDQTQLVWSPQAQDVSPSVAGPGLSQQASPPTPAQAVPPVPLAADYRPITAAPEPAAAVANQKPIPDAQPAAPVEDIALAEPASNNTQADAAAASYKVQKGDTLYSLASRYYGAANAGQYRVILQANRAALGTKNTLQVGQALVIPPLPRADKRPAVEEVGIDQLADRLAARSAEGPASIRAPAQASAAAGGTAQKAPRGAPLEATGDPRAGAAPSASSHAPSATKAGPPTGGPAAASAQAPPSRARTYTVKRGDTLTRIAALTMRDASKNAVSRLHQANRRALKNPNALVEGMTLTIPG